MNISAKIAVFACLIGFISVVSGAHYNLIPDWDDVKNLTKILIKITYRYDGKVHGPIDMPIYEDDFKFDLVINPDNVLEKYFVPKVNIERSEIKIVNLKCLDAYDSRKREWVTLILTDNIREIFRRYMEK